MQIAITGKITDDPRTTILAVEGVVRELCRHQGKDPAEGAMMLLTAAAHIHMQYAKPGTDLLMSLAEVLVYAQHAANGFFGLSIAKEGE